MLRITVSKLSYRKKAIVCSFFVATGSGDCCLLLLHDTANKIDKDISEIATWTNLSEISVKRSLKELNENKIITTIKSNSDNRRNVYLINPQSSWKGVIEKAQQLKILFDLFHNDNDVVLDRNEDE